MIEKDDCDTYLFYESQKLILACCVGDLDAIDNCIDIYNYSLLSAIVEGKSENHDGVFYTLQIMGYNAVANTLMRRGIDLFERETNNSQYSSEQLYLLFDSLMGFATCIDDTQRFEDYRNKQKETLALGFEISK